MYLIFRLIWTCMLVKGTSLPSTKWGMLKNLELVRDESQENRGTGSTHPFCLRSCSLSFFQNNLHVFNALLCV
jgi:hypothetical protein